MATRNRFLLVAMLGVLGLTACNSDITSYPKDGPILPPSDEKNEIYHNELSAIYESIRDGSLPSDVLDKLLYEYANTIFGRYTKSAPSYSTNESNDKTVKSVVEGGGEADMKAFVDSHKGYWPNGEKPEAPTADEYKVALARLEAIYNAVEDRIAEALYSQISGGAYTEHSYFSEKKFLASLNFDGKNVKDYKTATTTEDFILIPEIEAKEVFSKNVLHKENYYDEDAATPITYAIDENIESIYKDLLIEQYITDESYTTLGRSYARKVNVLALTVDSSNKGDVPALVNYLVDEIIASKTGANKLTIAADDRHGEEAVKNLYAQVAKIMKGLPEYFDGSNAENALPKQIVEDLYTKYGLFGDTATLAADGYLTSTAYGSMMKDYLKIKEDLVTTDASIESSFTGSGSYTVEQGKEYKEREIELKSYVTTGWHIKNGGLSDLPETIRNRVFNLSVASALDSDSLTDRTAADWSYDAEQKANKYVAKVNGAYFLKAETVEDKTSNKDLYFYDSGSSTYYFVQIVEAVNPAKLSVSGTGRYAEIYKDNDGTILQETIARDVCEVVAKISSYNGLAKDHWLKQMSLKYHDSKIYDYFKSNYPDLFD